jgi:ribosomal protein S6--L-glutamate ligase
MDIYFMLAFTRSTLNPNPVLVELFDILRRDGHNVELGVADELVMDPSQFTARHDLYILKSHTALWLSLAGILHCQGARMVNPYPSCVAAHDKIAAQRQLEAAGVPVPRSWVTGDLQLLRPLAEERALIVKPYIGGRGVGVVLATNPRELAAIPTPQQPMLIQEYVPGDELKVSVIGETVAGIRKVETADGTVRVPCPISDAVRAIALRCGEVFGLGLYGLDVIEGPRGPVVIDLNYFPSYKGTPGAAALLADYIVSHAAGGEVPSVAVPVSGDGRRVGVREPVAA